MPAGIDLPGAVGDSWDAVHVRTWNFMPSLMRHVGVAPMWVLRLLDAVWVGMAVALICVVVRMVRLLRREGLRPAA
jgi:MFS superfamily sulfate permease-like transporter